MRKSNNNIELKEGYIYSFYYDNDPDHIFHFVYKNGKYKVLLYEQGSLPYALFSIGSTCFSHINKPNLKEIGKINNWLKIIFTLGLCGFVEGQGILDRSLRYFYKGE